MEVILSDEEIKEYTDEIIAYNNMRRFETELNSNNVFTYEEYLTDTRVNDCVNYLVSEAKKHEKTITEDLRDVLDCFDDKNECHFEGLDNRIKKEGRIKEKLFDDARKKYGNDYFYASTHLYDTLRYTVILPFENHFDYLDNFLNDLLDRDYRIYRIKNRWTDDFCKGVSVVVQDPTGYAFEIQFHTQENYNIKEIYSREPYKLSRDPMAPNKLKDKANALRSYYHKLAHLPEGAETYEFKRKESTK